MLFFFLFTYSRIYVVGLSLNLLMVKVPSGTPGGEELH